jgi:hypothetical protein
MVTRGEMVRGVAAGAVIGGLLPKALAVQASGALDLKCRSGLPQVGPLIPTPRWAWPP